MATLLLDNREKMAEIDKSGMINFCTDSPKHYRAAAELAKKIKVNYPKPDNIIVAGLGGSAIGGDLLKDWARDQLSVPIEVSRDYNLPSYADKKTLVLVTSYSGDTEETLGSFLDALKRKCMVFCISSGGALIKYAQKHKVPYIQVPPGMPPRAASPYLLVPLLFCLEKTGLVSGVTEQLNEAITLLEKISKDNSPQTLSKDNFAKTLAKNIGDSVPVVYGFGFYRSVAQRFKQQFNENSKVPAKWEFFPELNHNETVGWKSSGCFSIVLIRDKDEPIGIKSRIETTKQIMDQAGLKMFEIWAQGKSPLAKMISTIVVGDFTSVYLALLHNVDPTPVAVITHLKGELEKNGVKEKILEELKKTI